MKEIELQNKKHKLIIERYDRKNKSLNKSNHNYCIIVDGVVKGFLLTFDDLKKELQRWGFEEYTGDIKDKFLIESL